MAFVVRVPFTVKFPVIVPPVKGRYFEAKALIFDHNVVNPVLSKTLIPIFR